MSSTTTTQWVCNRCGLTVVTSDESEEPPPHWKTAHVQVNALTRDERKDLCESCGDDLRDFFDGCPPNCRGDEHHTHG